MRIRTGLLIFLSFVSAGVRAQQQTSAPPDPPLTQTVTVAVNSMDGKPLAGLRSADFVLNVDGKRQSIDDVSARKPGPRVIALFLDEFHVASGATDVVREAAHRFIEQQVRPDDRVVVLKPLDSLPAIHLTADRARMHDAIDGFAGRKGNLEPRSPLEEQTIGRSPALAEAARAQVVLSGLRALASRLGTQPGRAGIILISEGFTRDARLANARALPSASIVERFANRFDVPVFTLDPVMGADDDSNEMTLEQLAAQTGGFFERGGDLAKALQRASAELDGGYVLRFTVPHGSDGRYHDVSIQTTRRNATARARAGYIAPQPPALRAAFAHDTAEPLTTRLQHRSRFIDVWSGITRFVDADGQVVVTWEPGGPFAASGARASRVSLVATQPNGTVLFKGDLSPVRYDSTPGTDVVTRAAFNAPPGRVYLDMTIFGERGEKLDIDARDVEVPAAGPTPQLMPPVFVAARSAREFREVAANAEAAPDPGREFSRTTQLLIRVAISGGSTDARVSARLLNLAGQTLRTLDAMPSPSPGVSQFDLPLAPFAPGDYILQVTATGGKSPVEQRTGIRITG
ncbi:MAG TPA: VWA domain-containing protein [Vicinamibacterales bacterium]|nr:VWA domain-containing protein [Vicinamibacterales bacterium]